MIDSMSRSIAIVYVIGFLDLFGVSLFFPLISKHARILGASPSTVGFLGSIYGGLQLFAAPIIGQWSDRSGCRHVLLWTLLLASSGYFISGIASNIVILALARIPNGLFKHTQELGKAYLAGVIPKDKQSEAFGRLNAISSIGFVIGPTIGGHIAQMNGGFFICSFLCGMIFLLNFGLVWMFIPQNMQKLNTNVEKTDNKLNLNPFSLIQTFKRIEWVHLWDIFTIRFLIGFAILIYRSNFSMWLDYKFQVEATTIGYLSSLSAIVGTLTSFVIGRIARLYKENNTKMLFHAGCVQFTVILSLSLATNVWVVACVMLPLSVANAVARVASTNVTLERGQGQDIGTLLGLGASILSVARMAAPALGGIAQEFHISGPTIAGSILAASGVSVMLISKQFRKEAFSSHVKLKQK